MDLVQTFMPPFVTLSHWYRPILYSIISIISVNVIVYSDLDRMADSIGVTYNKQRDTFDFIVVGGGSAGAVVASRLSENFDVLLLEAGGEQSPLSSIPALAILMLGQPSIDWMYRSTPQKRACLAMNNQQSAWPRGKGLGGSSNLNFMAYLRGAARDYDNWANITGDPRWSYENVMQFFQKSENYKYKNGNKRALHATGGYLNVEQPPYTGLASTFVKAGQELGFPETDLNGNFTEGFETLYYSQKNGRRFGTGKAFLEPFRNRPSLTIYKYSHVNRVLMGPDHRAYGVEYERHGAQWIAKANREIILSAGAVNTPKILMLSGIGPHEHLKSHKIPVRVNSPVGQNLQDHITAFVGPFTVNQTVTFHLDRDLDPKAFHEFAQYGTGPLTSTGIQAAAFLVSKHAKAAGEGSWPDFIYMLLGTSIYNKAPADFERAFNVQNGVLEKYYKSARNKDSFMIIATLARPKTRGQVLLAGSNPALPPLMDPNYFEHEDDMKVLVEGMERAVHLVENTTIFQGMNARMTDTPFPGCEDVEYRSYAYYECFARRYSLTLYHPAGTCPMGRSDDKKAVLDSELRVKGVKGIRVVDASIMPTIVSSNPNAACIMIGEMGADLVTRTWRPKTPQPVTFQDHNFLEA